MNKLELFQGKKCVSCGRFFEADPRVGKRQKSCGAVECRKKRKRMQERAWKERNPDYFQDFYASYVKPWRETHPEYQKRWRSKRRREIKTQFLRVTQTGQGFWVDGAGMQAA